MWQPTLAAIFALWPAPLGSGYLFLKRWGRFTLAFIGLQMIGVPVARMMVGSDAVVYYAAVVYAVTILDTWRLAYLRSKELRANAEAAPEGTTGVR